MNKDGVCDLIVLVYTKDSEGYEVVTEQKKQVFCRWEDGVSQSEFYRANKADMRASAQIEVFREDLREAWPLGTPGERRFVDLNGIRYKVIRDFPQTLDTQTVILEEMER